MFELTVKNTGFSKPEIDEGGTISVRYGAPRIVYVNQFTEDTSKEFFEAMIGAQNTGQSIIPVIVDSYGGEVYSLLKMIDVIRASKIPVATICMGKAMSCGSVLLTCGAEGQRYMAPHATIMIHDATRGSIGKVEEFKADAKELERANKLLNRIMAENCGHDSEYFTKLIHEHSHADWYLDATEAKQHNIINHVRIPKIKLAFDAEMTFG